MVRVSLLNLVAIATLLLGAKAGPCKPRTTAATSLAETTSSLVADTTATSIDTTAVTTVADTTTTVPGETTTTALPDTTTTDEAESATTTEAGSTTTASADTTTTTEAESTTTTAAAGCVETQLFVNPNFDDSSSDIAPWSSNAALTQNQPQSGTNALSATFSNGEPDYYFKQTLQNLNGIYRFSYYYRVVSVSQGADYVCNIQLSAGSVSDYGPMYDSVGGWRTDSVILDMGDDTTAQADVQLGLSCYGEFTGIEVDIDTLAFTRVCGAA
ncbi:hypothetical protein FAGAP_4844 [Fusarium agapanthi]|uniref:CBM-cenC domain-containing protein n=1 Tax=Fusarium agapanthi TaxID=1803897 RepID=A0A9P5BEA6_9HYPO|nr:hypothetical protein FAGAP_4844 [Fusarium agapanthi]